MKSVAFYPDNQIDLLVTGGALFPALVSAIDAASREIHFETYIFDMDSAGLSIRDALCRAAQRGVFVTVIVDWLGTGSKTDQQLRLHFERYHVQYRTFNAWFRRGWARSHRKLCVVDETCAFVGGINVNDDMYNDRPPHQLLPYPRWDFAVRVQGPLVQVIQEEMLAQWMRVKTMDLRKQWKTILASLDDLRHPWEKFTYSLRRRDLELQAEGVVAAFIVRDNLRNRRTIERACLKAIGHARQHVFLVNPYFSPGGKLRRALEEAVVRGVQVTLLLGVGQSRIQDAVTYAYYPDLLAAGVRILQYKKTQLHAKAVVVDEAWATVGSSNFDGFSLFVNQEANVVVYDRRFAKSLHEEIARGVADAQEVNKDAFAHIGIFRRAWYAIAFAIYRSVIRLMTRNTE